MKLYIFSIKDTCADVFGTPFFGVAPGAAMRGFADRVNEKDSTDAMTKHPKDFHLYQLGEYTDADGMIVVLEKPKLLARGEDLVVNRH